MTCVSPTSGIKIVTQSNYVNNPPYIENDALDKYIKKSVFVNQMPDKLGVRKYYRDENTNNWCLFGLALSACALFLVSVRQMIKSILAKN